MCRRGCVQQTHGREKGRWEEARQDKRTGGPPSRSARSELVTRTSTTHWRPCRVPGNTRAYRLAPVAPPRHPLCLVPGKGTAAPSGKEM